MAGTLLVIDDDKFIRNLIGRILDQDYRVETACDGAEGLAKIPDCKPDIILLDVEMPGINGYEVCDQIKQNPSTRHIPVLFLSSHGNLRERMLGYEVGANDFIVKPFEKEELKVKLNLIWNYLQDKDRLNIDAEAASKTAFAAMRGSSELGMAIQFVESTYQINDLKETANRFLDVTSGLNLSCTLMFRTYKGDDFHSSKGAVSPLEKELMLTLFDSGKRFNDFGCRTQINYERVALLIKNMPLDNSEAYGRLKDFLPTMLGATDAKIKVMITEHALVAHGHNLNHSFDAVKGTLHDVGKTLKESQRQVLLLLRSTIEELEKEIPKLALEEDQERYLINTLDGAIHATHSIIEQGSNASEAFDTVCQLLEHLAEKQQRLLNDFTSRSTDDTAKEVADATSDVELF